MLNVITGWSGAGWRQYGEIFLRSYLKYWPTSVLLTVYVEEPFKVSKNCRHGIIQRFLWDIPGARATVDALDTTLYRGCEPKPGWKERAVATGYNFRFDARKFCRQGLIPLDAATFCDPGDLLLWLDGDVATTRQVPEDFIPSLLPRGFDLTYLGRDPKHSEIGFQLYRLPEAVPMLAEFSALYTTGSILREKEWHSAYAFDIARRRSGIKAMNLTPGGSGDVWETTVLKRYMTHNKGDRKIAAQRAFYEGTRQ